MRPQVTLTPQADPSSATSPLVALRLRRSMAWPVGQVEAEFPPGTTSPSVGDAVKVSASSDSTSLDDIFTGTVLRQHVGLWLTRVLVEELPGPLTRLYQDKAIRSSTASEVISGLCSDAGVACSVTPPGSTVPSRALLSNRNALEQILDLARMSGLWVRTDVKGKLYVSLPVPTPTDVMLKLSNAVIDFTHEGAVEQPGSLAISGDGALGSHGPGADSWVVQSLTELTSGTGPPFMHMPGLKLAADVIKAAEVEKLRLAQAQQRLQVTLAGAPPADLGDAITLVGFPGVQPAAMVVGITMTWSVHRGLVTRLDLRGIEV